MNFIWKKILFLLMLVSWTMAAPESDWISARKVYYQSIEDKNLIDSAIQLFENLRQGDEQGVTEIYIGSLVVLKAKFAFLPHEKYRLAKKGLDIMDHGLGKARNNIEALFIYGSTCYYLPFFFHRKDDAIKSFKRIVFLLPDQYQNYPAQLVKNSIDFIERNIPLDEEDKRRIEQVKARMNSNEL